VQGPPTLHTYLLPHATLLDSDGCPALLLRRSFNPSGCPRQRGRLPSVWTLWVSGTLTPSPTASNRNYEAESLQGIAVPLAACGILYVRLTSFVRLPAPPEVQHSIRSGEFDPPRRGLSPRKIRAPTWRTNVTHEAQNDPRPRGSFCSSPCDCWGFSFLYRLPFARL